MISNASPLIFLSKIGKLVFLKKLFSKIIITPEVKDEVIVKERIDATVVEEAIKEGWIKVVKVEYRRDLGIKGAEESVINLARERKDKLIIDDAVGIKVAEVLGIEVIRTTSVIVMAVNKELIKKEEAVILLDRLMEEGYYIRPSGYAALLEKLKS